MEILVAGGAGFIGSHLIDCLLEIGHQVICVDKLVYGNKFNIQHNISKDNFLFINADLSNQKECDKIFEQNNIEIVYHLAANSDIQKGGQQPDIDFSDTFMTTRCVLESMRKYKVNKLFFASTSAVYGEKCDEVLSEQTGGLQPISYYGGAKLASEAMIYSYASMNDFSVIIFRFPNVIGPRLTHGVIFDFIKKLEKTPDKLKILGDGTQCKQYIYVYDLISAIVHCTDCWEKGIEIYNAGVVGEGTTVTKIADFIVEEMALEEVSYEYTGKNRGWKGDVPKFEYDISKILNTGWKPKYTSDEAVRQTIKDVIKK